MSNVIRGDNGNKILSRRGTSGVMNDGIEVWTETLSGTESAIRSVVSGLQVGGAYNGSHFMDKGNLQVCGWEVSQDGRAFEVSVRCRSSEITGVVKENLKESKTCSVSCVSMPVSIADCPNVWTPEQFDESKARARGIFVDYAKKKLAIPATSPYYEAELAEWKLLFEAELKAVGENASEPWNNESFLKVTALLASGQDLYNIPAYQAEIVEILNRAPSVSGLNTYEVPSLDDITLPNDAYSKAWILNSWSVETLPNGQFRSVRKWLGVAVKSPLYGNAE